MSTNVPLLEVPRKSTIEIDFAPPFRDFIENFYQEDSSKYAAQIAALNRIRQDARGAGKDIAGRDLCYKYFGQLELLSLRFPIQEDSLKIQFVWEDAFSLAQVSQYSVAFEKASVLFNIGATCSAIGALADRTDAQGLKTAYNYYQVAAGVFQYINDNFLHPPSVDLSRDSIAILVDLMLCQAQETFIEKVLAEKKSGILVAKLAMYVGSSYFSISQSMIEEPVKNQWNTTWLSLIRSKSNYFLALAHLHRSVVAEEKADYGEIVTFLQSADKYAQEAMKATDSFGKGLSLSSFFSSVPTSIVGTPSSPKSLTIPCLDFYVDACNSLASTISLKLKIAVKDNNMIYNATIPSIDVLAPIDKLKVVKTMQFQELLPNGKQDLAAIIGSDLFEKLIPIKVHESASVYSDSKDAILRKQKQVLLEMEEYQTATLLSLPIENIKRLKLALEVNGGLHQIDPPKDLLDSINAVGVDEKKGGLSSMITKSNTLTEESRKLINEIMLILDKEQYDNEQMKVKYAQDWSIEPSSLKNRQIREAARNHASMVEHLVSERQSICAKFSGLSNFMELIKLPHSSLVAKFVTEVTQPLSTVPSSLLDESIADNDITSERNLVNKILSMIDRARLVTKDARLCLEELDRRIKSDDISSILLLNHGREEEIYKAELNKFYSFESQIEAMAKESQNILSIIGQEVSQLQRISKTSMNLEKTERNISAQTTAWENDLISYMETKSSIESNFEALESVYQSLNSERNAAINFANQRLIERQNLAEKIDSNLAEASQRVLRAQLEKLQMGASTGQYRGPNQSSSHQSNYVLPQPGIIRPSEQLYNHYPAPESGSMQSAVLFPPNSRNSPQKFSFPASALTPPIQSSNFSHLQSFTAGSQGVSTSNYPSLPSNYPPQPSNYPSQPSAIQYLNGNPQINSQAVYAPVYQQQTTSLNQQGQYPVRPNSAQQYPTGYPQNYSAKPPKDLLD